MPSEIKRNNRCKGVRREWLHGVGLILVEELDVLDKNVSRKCFRECVCNEVALLSIQRFVSDETL